MLTSLFYYGHYKPYIIHEADGVRGNARRQKIAPKSLPESAGDSTFMLNKSLKTDVIKYARDISGSVTSLKDAAKHVAGTMEEFNKNSYTVSLDKAKEWLSEDMEAFAETFNEKIGALAEQPHSGALRELAAGVRQRLAANKGGLREMGLTIGANGMLSFNADELKSRSEGYINVSIGENINIFQGVYDDVTEILREPLSEHMNFKSLHYYYNYKYGAMVSDTFKIVESGMLIDKAV